MSDQESMRSMLREIAEAAPAAVWTQLPMEDTVTDSAVRAYQGTVLPWVFMVISFDIENQGHPKGSRGYDGTAVRTGAILHLTRELAERLYKLAEEKAGT